MIEARESDSKNSIELFALAEKKAREHKKCNNNKNYIYQNDYKTDGDECDDYDRNETNDDDSDIDRDDGRYNTLDLSKIGSNSDNDEDYSDESDEEPILRRQNTMGSNSLCRTGWKFIDNCDKKDNNNNKNNNKKNYKDYDSDFSSDVESIDNHLENHLELENKLLFISKSVDSNKNVSIYHCQEYKPSDIKGILFNDLIITRAMDRKYKYRINSSKSLEPLMDGNEKDIISNDEEEDKNAEENFNNENNNIYRNSIDSASNNDRKNDDSNGIVDEYTAVDNINDENDNKQMQHDHDKEKDDETKSNFSDDGYSRRTAHVADKEIADMAENEKSGILYPSIDDEIEYTVSGVIPHPSMRLIINQSNTSPILSPVVVKANKSPLNTLTTGVFDFKDAILGGDDDNKETLDKGSNGNNINYGQEEY